MSLLQRLLQQKYLMILIVAFFPISVHAGCDTAASFCKVITDSQEKTIGCTVKVCASASDYWIKWDLTNGTEIVEQASTKEELKITINGASGITVPGEDKYEICYALLGTVEKFCMKQPSF